MLGRLSSWPPVHSPFVHSGHVPSATLPAPLPLSSARTASSWDSSPSIRPYDTVACRRSSKHPPSSSARAAPLLRRSSSQCTSSCRVPPTRWSCSTPDRRSRRKRPPTRRAAPQA
eukprot:364833-Chlamydomonas_euryale.AAC.22